MTPAAGSRVRSLTTTLVCLLRASAWVLTTHLRVRVLTARRSQTGLMPLRVFPLGTMRLTSLIVPVAGT